MPRINKEDMNARISALLGDRTDDEALNLVTDLNDTFDEFADNTNWHDRYDQNDKEWRTKYMTRFKEGSNNPPANEPDSPDADTIGINDLFK